MLEEAFVMVPKGVKTRLDELTESASAARLVRVTNMLIYQSPGRNLAFKGDQSLQEAIKAVDRGLFFHFRMGNKHAPTVKVLTEVVANSMNFTPPPPPVRPRPRPRVPTRRGRMRLPMPPPPPLSR